MYPRQQIPPGSGPNYPPQQIPATSPQESGYSKHTADHKLQPSPEPGDTTLSGSDSGAGVKDGGKAKGKKSPTKKRENKFTDKSVRLGR